MNRLGKWLVFTSPLLLALVLAAPEGLARPGGGNTYRGSSSSSSGSSRSYSSSGSSRSYGSSSSSYSGSSSGSSGGGSSDGSGFCCLVFGVLAVVIVISSVSNKKNPPRAQDWSTVKQREQPRPWSQEREKLERLRTVGPAGPDGRPVPFDPDFSLVPFEDFLYALYARVHTARGGGQLETMAAYLSEKALQTLRGVGEPQRVEAIVVGAMKYLSVSAITSGSLRVSVRMRFEANYTEVSASGPRSFYVAEEWLLVRSTQVKSRSPENARVFKCPNCGAPLDGMQGNTCSYCQKTVNTGEFDWVVYEVTEVERESRGPQLGGDTPEEGTNLSTVKQPRVDERMQRLLQQDPEMSWEALTARLGFIFQELQVAWSERQWEQVRPYVSDSLFQTQLYWMGAYERAGLRNVTQNARITQVELARVVSDRYFVALTVRVFATGLDFTLRESDGKVVGGSQRRERRYTEYWTLIRSSTARGKPSTEKRCPSCGAPLSINMAGQCTHCSARVTSGDFDWVLSRIEQDESYQG
ncbi:TIM44-like domain-containing protein [Archangium sp.]|uniref:TIM44-like domain-containing protein n=1 Tax=Archangium sp. TaxID=1872627 RepID=UPI003899D6BF